ncbi:MAG: hybrid sensor histidine kinase/response regulator [Gallionellales bacterium CG_4_10_14_3_um_filter_54_96]|nr:MAG: hybrid sensor histidine kinase/response regulator [Gallionellales bacterium CG03_land_8_20_14_0_80_55_15]PIY06163.1 MAG: hybrid sensor histidine kinase/response regulator [Gallionellales bacterium CG_4_10_14_3_um_filter_54_96]
MKQFCIQKQIVTLAFMPLLLISLSFEAFFLYGHYTDMTQSLITPAQFNQLLFQSLAITILLLGVLIYLLWLVSRRITAPIVKLSSALQSIAQGKPAPSAAVTTQASELCTLAQGINTLTEKLQREHEILQQRIDDATQSLRNKKELAERDNQNSSRFLAVASHELRQPLHALNLYISELQRKVVGAEPQHLVGQINHSVEALTQMLNSLLDISKLDARTIVPQIETFRMGGLLERISANHILLARIKNIRLVVRPCSCCVSSDQLLLERILMNLVSNAIRYTEPNGSVLVACRHRGQKVRIEVRDNGIGIAKEDQDNIFREFHQCKRPQLDMRKGLGLGLAIVDRLVKLLNCQLELRSVPNVGTVFALEIPAAQMPDKQPDQETVRATNISAISCLLGKKILVVDDDPLVLESTAHILISWGCTVSSADSMDAVNKLLETNSDWDLIITDYQLEDSITGLNVMQVVKQQLERKIPCILITGNTSQEISRLVSLGGDRVLYKPVSPAKLRSLVEFLLKGSD